MAINEMAFNKITYGLFVLTAKDGNKDNGCIINTVNQLTVFPQTISITVSDSNYTCEMIKKTGRFNISVLNEYTPFSVFEELGFKSGREVEKFNKNSARTKNSIVYLPDVSCAVFSAKVFKEIKLSTHTLFLAEVEEAEVLNSLPPLSYSYYYENIKPKNTKVPCKKSAENEGKIWVCNICGYCYDDSKEKVPFEELPDDWVCPLCKHPKSDFSLLQ